MYPVMTCLSVFSHLSSKLWSNQTYFAATYGHHNVTLQNQQVMLAIPSKTKRHRRVVSVNQYLANNHEVFRYKRFVSRYPQAASFLPLEEDPTSPIMRHLVHDDGIEPPPSFKVSSSLSALNSRGGVRMFIQGSARRERRAQGVGGEGRGENEGRGERV